MAYSTKNTATTPANLDSLVNGANAKEARQKVAVAIAEQKRKKQGLV